MLSSPHMRAVSLQWQAWAVCHVMLPILLSKAASLGCSGRVSAQMLRCSPAPQALWVVLGALSAVDCHMAAQRLSEPQVLPQQPCYCPGCPAMHPGAQLGGDDPGLLAQHGQQRRQGSPCAGRGRQLPPAWKAGPPPQYTRQYPGLGPSSQGAPRADRERRSAPHCAHRRRACRASGLAQAQALLQTGSRPLLLSLAAHAAQEQCPQEPAALLSHPALPLAEAVEAAAQPALQGGCLHRGGSALELRPGLPPDSALHLPVRRYPLPTVGQDAARALLVHAPGWPQRKERSCPWLD